MGAFIFGIVLFALCIAVSIALHEAGHMLIAKACGMRVRRYFIGFGPTVVSATKGGTEYGLAALPLGGFCDIAGMTAQGPLTPEEAPYAMYRKPWWQRVAVMSGGIAMNLLLGFIVLYALAVFSGIPNPYADRSPRVEDLTCVADQIDADTLAECSGPGPAEKAGIKPGDRLIAVDGSEVSSFVDVRDDVLERPGETVELTVERNGQRLLIDVPVATVNRLNADGDMRQAGAVGMSSAPVIDAVKRFGPVEAVPATVRLSGEMIKASVQGLVAFPSKLPGVAASIFGGERDVEGPISVVGASRTGGELAQRSMWNVFFSLLASLNFFLALFNLVPLPPLDGGHIAVVLWEKARDQVRRLRGLPSAGPVNYDKLMPLTYAMATVLLAVGFLVIVADVVNPVRLF